MKTNRPGPSGETIDTPQHRALGSASRAAILQLVRAADAGLTSADIAGQTGLHQSTVRAHLDRLVEAGLLMKARASGGAPGRPAWRYRSAASEPAPAPYRALAGALLEHLATTGGGTPAAHQAGRVWGRQLPVAAGEHTTPVEATLGVLHQLGFDPRRHSDTSGHGDDAGGDGVVSEPGDGGGDVEEVEIHLYACPFLELVGQHPDVMCGLHAGMLRGVLDATGAPDAHAVLEPFAAPTACVARLRTPSRPAGRPSRPGGRRP